MFKSFNLEHSKTTMKILVVSNPLHKLVRMSQKNVNNFIVLVNDIINDKVSFDTKRFNDWEICNICVPKQQRPNFMLKIEHCNEDLMYLFEKINVTCRNDIKPFASIDSSVYIDQLTKRQRIRLFQVLRSHYELFGYNPYEDLLK